MVGSQRGVSTRAAETRERPETRERRYTRGTALVEEAALRRSAASAPSLMRGQCEMTDRAGFGRVGFGHRLAAAWVRVRAAWIGDRSSFSTVSTHTHTSPWNACWTAELGACAFV